jgi:hypothetical protein
MLADAVFEVSSERTVPPDNGHGGETPDALGAGDADQGAPHGLGEPGVEHEPSE